MRFFIPAAKDEESAQGVYDAIKEFLGKELGAEFSDRKVQRLAWHHEGKDYEAEVGKATTFNGELVIAILYEPFRKVYHVCTPNRGVARGMSILAGEWAVADVADFDGESA